MGTIDGARILITGGSGSFGTHLVEHLFANDNPEKVVIFSRGEKAQCEMEDRFAYYKSKMRFILGSVTDRDRITRACRGIDFVVHAAALKVVPKLEYNPLECHDVNVVGTRNVVNAIIESKVGSAVFIATDKGVMPVNYYGYCKGTAERMFLEANYIEPVFRVARYGNIMGSRGSVINYFMEMRREGVKEYPLTHIDCTRFWVDYPEAISLCLAAMEEKPGVVLASKTKSFKVKDLIKAIYLRAELKVTGLREGEKVHETLVSEYEACRTKEMPHAYRIFPAYSFDDTILYEKEEGHDVARAVVSNDPANMMGLDELRKRVDAIEQEAKNGPVPVGS